MGITQYEQLKAELELLRMLAESKEDEEKRQVASIQDTFESIRQSPLLSLIWTLTALFNYLTTSRKMTISEWRTSSVRLKHASLYTALCLAVTSLMTILYLLLNKTYSTREIVCVLTYFFAALASLLLNHLEKKVRHIYEKSPQSIEADAFMVE